MSFKEEFDRYKEAINNDIKEVELVIAWLEQFQTNFENTEKIISFFKGHLSRIKIEKAIVHELSLHIDEK